MSEEKYKKKFLETMSKKLEIDIEKYEISDYYWRCFFEMEQENKKLHSIIKEVREYIENNGHYDFYNLDVAVDGEKLLEILDKENI